MGSRIYPRGHNNTCRDTFHPRYVKPSGPGELPFPQSMIYPLSSCSAPLPVALTFHDDTLAWDVRNSKPLLHCQDASPFSQMTFSSDGRFAAGVNIESGVHIWKYSPAGYVLYEKVISGLDQSRLHFSPNGESLIMLGATTVRLWHTINLTTPLSDSFVDPPNYTNGFLLEIFPNRSLAAVIRRGGRTVTLLISGRALHS